jgi:hypothetical protein
MSTPEQMDSTEGSDYSPENPPVQGFDPRTGSYETGSLTDIMRQNEERNSSAAK